MSDNKSRDIFYAVVAIATLIVALIGATLAYFSMTVSSSEGAVSAKAAVVSVDYEDGQQVIAQAEHLIPVDVEIMQQLYERNLAAINEQEENNRLAIEEGRFDDVEMNDEANNITHENRCQDGANSNYEVCSVFRFSISNPTGTTIRAALRSELNEFRDLAYAVRDMNCTPTTEEPLKCWLKLNGNDTYVRLKTCGTSTEELCYTEETERVYSADALRPIFGYDGENAFKTINIANTKQTYDVVLFILNKSAAQDYDQGKRYSGNLFIETTDSVQIQGRLN